MRRFAPKPALPILIAAACSAQIGCYKHVVRERGYGARSEEVYEPNVSDDPGWIEQTEDFIWGDPDPEHKR
jgi:hypothetical protein